MSMKSTLLAGTAALALSSPAFAATGDAYVSLFGGWSSSEGTDLMPYATATNTPYSRIDEFRGRRTIGAFFTTIERVNTKQVKTGPATYNTVTYTVEFDRRFGSSVLGGKTVAFDYNYTRDFSAEVTEQGFVIGASLGMELMLGLRGEVEAAFRRYDLDSVGQLNYANYNKTYLRRDAIYQYYRTIVDGLGSKDAYKNTTFVNPIYNFTTVSGTLNTAATPPITRTGTFTDDMKSVKALISDFDARDTVTNLNTTGVSARVDGELTAFSFMFNLWYDLPLGDSGLVPFVGAGIGVANLTLDYTIRSAPVVFTQGVYNQFYLVPAVTSQTKTATSGGNINTNTNIVTPAYTTPRSYALTKSFVTEFKDDAAVFAYQFGAGIGYEFRNGLRLTAQYRHFATAEGTFGSAGDHNVESNDFLLGVSFPLGRQRVGN